MLGYKLEVSKEDEILCTPSCLACLHDQRLAGPSTDCQAASRRMSLPTWHRPLQENIQRLARVWSLCSLNFLFPYQSQPPSRAASGTKDFNFPHRSSNSLGCEELAIHTSATWTIHSGWAALSNLERSIELRYVVSQLACPSGTSRHNTQFKSHQTLTRDCQALTTITQKQDKYCTHPCCDAGLT